MLQAAEKIGEGGPMAFSMREARLLLAEEDLRANLRHYWVDLLASWAAFLVSLHVMDSAALPLWARAIGFVAVVLLSYRCALFIHELSHQSEDRFRGFRLVWNLLIGIPFLVPTFVYQTHLDHHRRRHYGTSHDGEYLPFGTRPVWHLVAYLAQSFVIPLLAVVRFGLLTPLTWCGRPIREWVHRHASSMIIDPMYVRPLPSERQLRWIRLQEVACFLFILVVAALAVRNWMELGEGLFSKWFLLEMYAASVCVILLNAIRTIGAHRYYYDCRAEQDRPMSFTEQLVDSINYPERPFLTTLWAPVGLQFHALHHLFPSLPYHATRRVHARLMAGLPADSPYRRTNSRSLLHAMGDLWTRARASQRGGAGSAEGGRPRATEPSASAAS